MSSNNDGNRYNPSLTTADRGDLDEICFEYGFTNRNEALRKAIKLLNIACRTERDGGCVMLHNPRTAVPIGIRVRP